VLEAAVKGEEETEKGLSCFIEELRNAIFLVGAKEIRDLAKVPVVITGKTAEWLTTRGFKVETYAKRGAS
jgi:isopentenyl-diphosphate delta-isomerase